MTESYVKFHYTLERQDLHFPREMEILNNCRRRLLQAGLIGVYPNGIGYGNISLRLPETSQFLISATSTGNLANLSPQYWVKVTRVDLEHHQVRAVGCNPPSSESITHSVFYSADPSTGAVVHVHHKLLWQKLLDVVPSTSADASYGSPELARELTTLLRSTPRTSEAGIVVIGGHEEGIFAYAPSPDEATNFILDTFHQQL